MRRWMPFVVANARASTIATTSWASIAARLYGAGRPRRTRRGPISARRGAPEVVSGSLAPTPTALLCECAEHGTRRCGAGRASGLLTATVPGHEGGWLRAPFERPGAED